MYASDVDNDASMHTSDRSNVTTDDEFFNELVNAPPEFEDCLIPDNCPNELVALEHLTRCLNRRFNAYPALFMGILKDALKEAFGSKDINERRPLLIYVNNDKSVYTNLFCKQLLCNEKTVEYLMSNYVLWAWDVTYESNERKFNDICKTAFAPWNADKQFHSNSVDGYPLLVGIYRDTNGHYAFRYLMEGSDKKPILNDFLNCLSEFKNDFNNHEQQLQIAKEEERRQTISNLFQPRDPHHHHHHSSKHQKDRRYLRSISMLPHMNDDDKLAVNHPKFARLLSGNMDMRSYELLTGQTMTKEELNRIFQHSAIDSDEGDDEDDDRTPTVARPMPKFQ